MLLSNPNPPSLLHTHLLVLFPLYPMTPIPLILVHPPYYHPHPIPYQLQFPLHLCLLFPLIHHFPSHLPQIHHLPNLCPLSTHSHAALNLSPYLCHLPTQLIIKTHPHSPSLLLLPYHLISLPYTPTFPYPISLPNPPLTLLCFVAAADTPTHQPSFRSRKTGKKNTIDLIASKIQKL
ncbi:hypothetical protein POPTR_001G276904v4 [Populus trichocarpa]|uniref:Uncharacterized protein n=1 Tax=Populus trichocarpa TaxID=3694 RepID=A0ACC0TLL1_POPTR|nr:hypothetical protein POPTR_001G276904v4 [Populus trichocarpa]